jgi:hypothetical protein
MLKRLRIDKNFKPCSAEDGEEIYANGIFKFQIIRPQKGLNLVLLILKS